MSTLLPYPAVAPVLKNMLWIGVLKSTDNLSMVSSLLAMHCLSKEFVEGTFTGNLIENP
jgi:hypothetical protein